MKPNPTISRSGMAYHAVGAARGEIASLLARPSRFMETTSLLEGGLLHARLLRRGCRHPPKKVASPSAYTSAAFAGPPPPKPASPSPAPVLRCRLGLPVCDTTVG